MLYEHFSVKWHMMWYMDLMCIAHSYWTIIDSLSDHGMFYQIIRLSKKHNTNNTSKPISSLNNCAKFVCWFAFIAMSSVAGYTCISRTGEQELAWFPLATVSVCLWQSMQQLCCDTCSPAVCCSLAVTGCSYIMHTSSTNCSGFVISIIISLMMIHIKYSWRFLFMV